MGLERLRDGVLGAGVEERVEVNQRHLIDKILSRYSAKHVVYRELLQNADDALSKKVHIDFYTSSNEKTTLPQLSSKVVRVVVKNDGMEFRQEDWSRLKKIAEGNPDEQKIGAFGVGFYSLFGMCEGPFVTSGKECLAFYFKGDQLFAKRAAVPPEDQTDWTTFLLDVREPEPMPDLDDFATFLATSIGFTTNLREIVVHHDGKEVFKVEKRMAEARPMALDKTLVTTSPQGLFTLTGVSIRNVQLVASKYVQPSLYASSPFASLLPKKPTTRTGEGLEIESATIFLRIVSGDMTVRVSREFEREMERSTKKKPPKKTSYQMVFTGRDELDASQQHDIFRQLLPFPHQGRVFIGFPTHQTTGCCSHMAARFIPTVERESIDFVDRYIGVWNRELLAMGGLLCRIVYDDELHQIAQLYAQLKDNDKNNESKDWLDKRAQHVLQSFTFGTSTPSPLVGRLQESAFGQMSRQVLSLFSTHGVKLVTDVRLPESSMVFIKTIPTLSESTKSVCSRAMEQLQQKGLLKPLDVADVLKELENGPLSTSEMVSCMQWYLKSSNDIAAFVRVGIVVQNDTIVPLHDIQFWLNPRLIPSDLPLPHTVLPYTLSKQLSTTELSKFGWKELSLLDWVQFIVEREAFTAPFAEKVLGVLSRGMTQVSKETQTAMNVLLAQKACIPTTRGMQKPSDAYFSTVKLFDDLPMIQFHNPRAISDKLLLGMSVRKHVELQLVFDRLVAGGSWSHVDLVKYLTSVQGTLSTTEVARLRETKMFPMEGDTGTPPTRYKAAELFAPTDVLRGLQLPLLAWNSKWKQGAEATFLDILGLQHVPPLGTLLTKASPQTTNAALRSKALSYLVDHFGTHYSSVYKAADIKVAFLPCEQDQYCKPTECFSNPRCSVMGFSVLHVELRPHADKLGVRTDPTPEALIARLAQVEPDKAKVVFEYLATRQAEFMRKHWEQLATMRFIPVNGRKMEPTQCYFESEQATYYKELFTYIDFGTVANSFLQSCGVKNEPTTIELAEMIVRDPQRYWQLSGGGDRYLSVLRQIASNYFRVKQHRTLVYEMMGSAFLVATQKAQNQAEHENDEGFVQYRLAKAKDIFIVDDTTGQHIFNPLGAPMEPLLEEFYESLGSSRLSGQITESYTYVGRPLTTPVSDKVTKLIKERAPIITYQMLVDNPQRKNELIHDDKWLTQHVQVYQASEIKVTRTFKHTGQKNVQLTTACVDVAKCIVYITSTELDYYDIANSVCRLLFSRTRFNDAIVVERYLTASLDNLRRKGVPVDRIKNLKKVQDMPTLSESELRQYEKQVQMMFPDCEASYIRELLRRQTTNHVQNVVDQLLETDYPRAQPPGAFGKQSGTQSTTAPRTPRTPSVSDDRSVASPQVPAQARGLLSRLTKTFSNWSAPELPETSPTPETPKAAEPHTMTPNLTNNIKSNLTRAIQSCRPNSDSDVFSRPEVNTVKETRGYCDIRPGQSLTFVGLVKNVQFYIHTDLDPQTVLEPYSTQMNQFAELLVQISAIFKLNPNAMHMFYDVDGPTIAFNRNGSLFMNLRYYLALHAAQPQEALIYWFMTTCHELAHNFVGDHNAEHEFYMSSFAEVYLEGLIRRITIAE